MIIRKSNKIPVRQDGAETPHALGVENSSRVALRAGAGSSTGSAPNYHPSISDHSLVSTKVEHSICNDAADQSGTVVMIGVGGGVSLPFLFVHAPRSGEQNSPSQVQQKRCP